MLPASGRAELLALALSAALCGRPAPRTAARSDRAPLRTASAAVSTGTAVGAAQKAGLQRALPLHTHPGLTSPSAAPCRGDPQKRGRDGGLPSNQTLVVQTRALSLALQGGSAARPERGRVWELWAAGGTAAPGRAAVPVGTLVAIRTRLSRARLALRRAERADRDGGGREASGWESSDPVWKERAGPGFVLHALPQRGRTELPVTARHSSYL